MKKTSPQQLNKARNITDSIWWWLGRKHPFIINNEYKIELLYIDRVHYSAKIRVTNIKDGSSYEEDIFNE